MEWREIPYPCQQRRELLTALRSGKRSAALYLRLAAVHAYTRSYGTAYRYARKAHALDPRDTEALDLLVWIARRHCNVMTEIKYRELLAHLDPEDSQNSIDLRNLNQ